MDVAKRVAEVLDRQAILDQMARYCQAIDRCDLDLLKSTFHSDGVVDFGIFRGNSWEFCDYNLPFIRENLVMGWHRFTNVDIVLKGERAFAESYMLGNAAARTPDGQLIHCPDNMRYLDIWEKRDGVWRLYTRNLVLDWNACWLYTQSEGVEQSSSNFNGSRDIRDLSYKMGIIEP